MTARTTYPGPILKEKKSIILNTLGRFYVLSPVPSGLDASLLDFQLVGGIWLFQYQTFNLTKVGFLAKLTFVVSFPFWVSSDTYLLGTNSDTFPH